MTALASPTFLAAHAVVGFPAQIPRDPVQSEILATALREQFPNVITQGFMLTAGMPTQTPHMTLTSSSSQLAISAFQADFDVRFYGDYVTDIARALEFVERKLVAVLRGFTAINMKPALIGLVGTFHFVFADGDDGATAAHILGTHLNVDVDPASVQDVNARVAVRVRDTYYVSMALGNYEARIYERPLMPAMQQIVIRPWDGRVVERGLELTLDINNNLEARVKGSNPVVTEDGIRAVVSLLREVAATTGAAFAESGRIDVDSLATISTA